MIFQSFLIVLFLFLIVYIIICITSQFSSWKDLPLDFAHLYYKLECLN